MGNRDAPVVDSRGWTGPGPKPVPFDQRAALAAFRAAGDVGGAAPQRITSLVSWAGLALMLAVILVGADGRSRLLGLEPLAVRARAGLEEWLTGFVGSKGAERLVAVAGDPRILAALLVIACTLVGRASAWRHRAELARGFAAAEAGRPGAVFTTCRDWETASLVLFFWALNPPGGTLFAARALVLWLVARSTATGLVSIAERRAAGLGARGVLPSGWDVTVIALSLGAMLLVVAGATGVFD